MASGGYRPAMGVEQHLATSVATNGVPGQKRELQVGTDFPIVCETCLGPNPYVRMIKCRFGEKLCKLSNVPMQSFRWKAGPQGRFKETIVCREVAVEKNICQACLSDMTFGVPVGVRDALLRAGGAPEHGGYTEALSNANQAHYYGQRRAEIDSGGALGTAQRLEPSSELLSLARQIESANAKAGTAFRNLPKLCSFWTAGTCTRVAKGTCPFRPCCGLFKFPELARSHPDECLALVEDLKAKGAAKVMHECPLEVRQMLKDAGSGVNKEEAIRNRASGRDDQSRGYVSRSREKRQIEAPADTSITTLWVGATEGLAEADLVDAFYSFGELKAVRLANGCAFVEFADRSAAQSAADAKYRNLVIKGNSLPLDWARPRGGPAKRGHADEEGVGLPGVLPGEAPPALRPELQDALRSWGAAPAQGAPPPPKRACGGARPPHAPYPSMDPNRIGSRPGPPPRE